jgi:hypothetical protein
MQLHDSFSSKIDLFFFAQGDPYIFRIVFCYFHSWRNLHFEVVETNNIYLSEHDFSCLQVIESVILSSPEKC